jgi:hypothetical protein
LMSLMLPLLLVTRARPPCCSRSSYQHIVCLVGPTFVLLFFLSFNLCTRRIFLDA